MASAERLDRRLSKLATLCREYLRPGRRPAGIRDMRICCAVFALRRNADGQFNPKTQEGGISSLSHQVHLAYVAIPTRRWMSRYGGRGVAKAALKPSRPIPKAPRPASRTGAARHSEFEAGITEGRFEPARGTTSSTPTAAFENAANGHAALAESARASEADQRKRLSTSSSRRRQAPAKGSQRRTGAAVAVGRVMSDGKPVK